MNINYQIRNDLRTQNTIICLSFKKAPAKWLPLQLRVSGCNHHSVEPTNGSHYNYTYVITFSSIISFAMRQGLANRKCLSFHEAKFSIASLKKPRVPETKRRR